jgi:hypothetical protein
LKELPKVNNRQIGENSPNLVTLPEAKLLLQKEVLTKSFDCTIGPRCLEKFMRFINRNAYIMCAMKSTNFCSSSIAAFNL